VKLNNNKIESIDEFKGLQGSKINKISVSENPFIDNNKDYKKILFEMLPTLTAIDGEDKNGAPVNSTEYDEEDINEDEEDIEGEEFEDGEEIDEDDEDDGDDDNNEEDEDRKNNKKQKH
jgi:hypothetical protein